jgi:hypothetical protein
MLDKRVKMHKFISEETIRRSLKSGGVANGLFMGGHSTGLIFCLDIFEHFYRCLFPHFQH